MAGKPRAMGPFEFGTLGWHNARFVDGYPLAPHVVLEEESCPYCDYDLPPDHQCDGIALEAVREFFASPAWDDIDGLAKVVCAQSETMSFEYMLEDDPLQAEVYRERARTFIRVIAKQLQAKTLVDCAGWGGDD